MDTRYRSVLAAGLAAFLSLGFLLGLDRPSFDSSPRVAAGAVPASTKIEPQALDVLKQVSALIAGARSFTFRAASAREELATTGQAITFFSRLEIAVKRPNHLRVDVGGDVDNYSLWFDGLRVALASPAKNVYSTVPYSGNIDGLLSILAKRYNVYVPVTVLLSSNLYAVLSDGLLTGFEVGQVFQGGEVVRQLAFTEQNVDWQVWVQMGGRPLPKRLALTYKAQKGAPREWYEFRDWNLAADVPPERFIFTPEPGAAKIAIKSR